MAEEATIIEDASETTPVEERPAWLPEKFADGEALAKSYGELEKKLSAPKPPLAIEEAIPVLPTADDATGLDALIEKSGLKREDLAKAFTEKGDLSAEQYAAFKKLGLGKALVKDTIAGIALMQQKAVDAALDQCKTIAGGEEQLNTLLTYARSLPSQVVDDLNRRLANTATMQGAILEIHGRYSQAVKGGQAKPLLEGGAAAGSVETAYRTQADFYKGAQAAKASAEARAKHDARCSATPAVHTLPRD